jgi:hypothetical protein
MTWYAWVAVAVLALNALCNVPDLGSSNVGKRRAALVVIVAGGLYVWCIFALAERAA